MPRRLGLGLGWNQLNRGKIKESIRWTVQYYLPTVGDNYLQALG
jgi:hypothetical protein